MAKRAANGSIDVTQGVIWRQLLALCVPIFFSSFFQQAYALINTYIVGQFGGKIALGGIQSTLSLRSSPSVFASVSAPAAPSSPGSSLGSATMSAYPGPCIPP